MHWNVDKPTLVQKTSKIWCMETPYISTSKKIKNFFASEKSSSFCVLEQTGRSSDK